MVNCGAWNEVIRRVEPEVGPFSILCNNVVVGFPFLPTEDIPEEDWGRVVDISLVACFVAYAPLRCSAVDEGPQIWPYRQHRIGFQSRSRVP